MSCVLCLGSGVQSNCREEIELNRDVVLFVFELLDIERTGLNGRIVPDLLYSRCRLRREWRFRE